MDIENYSKDQEYQSEVRKVKLGITAINSEYNQFKEEVIKSNLNTGEKLRKLNREIDNQAKFTAKQFNKVYEELSDNRKLIIQYNKSTNSRITRLFNRINHYSKIRFLISAGLFIIAICLSLMWYSTYNLKDNINEINTELIELRSINEELQKKVINQSNYIRSIEERISTTSNDNIINTGTINSDEPEVEYIEMSLPEVDGEFKPYMDYRTITSKSSDQYKYQQDAITNDEGFRMYDGRYMVAMGTYYVGNIGDKFNIELTDDNGETKVVECVIGDVKADAHTDSNHQYAVRNQDIIEFIVDTDYISSTSKSMGDMSHSGMDGEVSAIYKAINS